MGRPEEFPQEEQVSPQATLFDSKRGIPVCAYPLHRRQHFKKTTPQAVASLIYMYAVGSNGLLALNVGFFYSFHW